MTSQLLRLYTDTHAANAVIEPLLPLPRAIYLVSGSAIVRAAGQAASLEANSAWCGSAAPAVTAGKNGARLLRWELVRKQDAASPNGASPAALSGAAPESVLTLEQEITFDPAAECLMRCDRVGFPAGGEALTHVHQGPGIRCLLAGSLRIDSEGASHSYAPGEAWFEAGPQPVYAAASRESATAFVRVMILPRSCHGKSSIRYVRPEDADKPKTQTYQIFADEFITP